MRAQFFGVTPQKRLHELLKNQPEFPFGPPKAFPGGIQSNLVDVVNYPYYDRERFWPREMLPRQIVFFREPIGRFKDYSYTNMQQRSVLPLPRCMQVCGIRVGFGVEDFFPQQELQPLISEVINYYWADFIVGNKSFYRIPLAAMPVFGEEAEALPLIEGKRQGKRQPKDPRMHAGHDEIEWLTETGFDDTSTHVWILQGQMFELVLRTNRQPTNHSKEFLDLFVVLEGLTHREVQ